MIEGDEYDCAFFDKRPKFVHYLPERGGHRQRRVRPRRHLPRPRGGAAAFVRLLSVMPAAGAARRRDGEPGARGDPAQGALPGRDVRAPRRGRLAGGPSVPDRARGLPVPAPPRGPGRGRVRAPAWRASTTSGTRWRPWPRPRRRASSRSAVREALAAFRGVKRRLEVRGEARGVTVYDDFAHHPTAVAATLAALRALGGRRARWWRCSSRGPTPPGRASSRTTSPGPSRRPTG